MTQTALELVFGAPVFGRARLAPHSHSLDLSVGRGAVHHRRLHTLPDRRQVDRVDGQLTDDFGLKALQHVPILVGNLREELGLLSRLDIVVTSRDTGFNKPQPEIFQEALRQANVRPQEAVYVGDQYQADVIGSGNVGMKGMLLDRNNFYTEIKDCPRLQSLGELAGQMEG